MAERNFKKKNTHTKGNAGKYKQSLQLFSNLSECNGVRVVVYAWAWWQAVVHIMVPTSGICVCINLTLGAHLQDADVPQTGIWTWRMHFSRCITPGMRETKLGYLSITADKRERGRVWEGTGTSIVERCGSHVPIYTNIYIFWPPHGSSLSSCFAKNPTKKYWILVYGEFLFVTAVSSSAWRTVYYSDTQAPCEYQVYRVTETV